MPQKNHQEHERKDIVNSATRAQATKKKERIGEEKEAAEQVEQGQKIIGLANLGFPKKCTKKNDKT